jgi:poly(glycerol-phosphate) alpha-glucosyltransferase
LPQVVLEAWSYGVPVLMTEACNLPNGFSVKAAIRIGQDVSSIKTGIAYASALSLDERANMSHAARDLVEKTYSRKAVCEQIAQLYYRAVESVAVE